MKKWNYVVSAVMTILGIAMIAMSLPFKFFLSSGDPGPGFWPTLLGSALVVCSILLAVMSTISAAKEEEKEVIFSSPAHTRVYKMMAVAVLFCVAMYVFGFYIAMMIFMPLAMKLMGTESDKTITITTFCTLVAIFVAFQIGLKTSLPAPIFWR